MKTQQKCIIDIDLNVKSKMIISRRKCRIKFVTLGYIIYLA